MLYDDRLSQGECIVPYEGVEALIATRRIVRIPQTRT